MSLGAKHGLGIDQSKEFLKQAEELNACAAAPCEFLEADIYQLPDTVTSKFDVAFITIGVLGWMPDLQTFFAAVSSLLVKGGTLVIYETHPFLEMFLPDEAIIYDDSKPPPAAPWYWFNHPFHSIINGCIDSGLSIDRLNEYAHSNREVEYDIYRDQEIQLPMCFSLIASKTRG